MQNYSQTLFNIYTKISMNWIGWLESAFFSRTKRFRLTFATISRESCGTSAHVLRSGRRTRSVTGSAIYTRVWIAGGVCAWNVRKSLHKRQKNFKQGQKTGLLNSELISIHTHTGFAHFSLEYTFLKNVKTSG